MLNIEAIDMQDKRPTTVALHQLHTYNASTVSSLTNSLRACDHLSSALFCSWINTSESYPSIIKSIYKQTKIYNKNKTDPSQNRQKNWPLIFRTCAIIKNYFNHIHIHLIIFMIVAICRLLQAIIMNRHRTMTLWHCTIKTAYTN